MLVSHGFRSKFHRFPAMQEVWKSVNIWRSYREYKGGNFFETQCILRLFGASQHKTEMKMDSWHEKNCTRLNKQSVHCDAQLTDIHANFWVLLGFWPPNWVRLTWFLACDQGSLVGLCYKDYKSLCAAATICATLVSVQILTRTGSILTSSRIAQPSEREKVSKIGIRF